MKRVATAVFIGALAISAGCSSTSPAGAPAATSLPSGIDAAGMDKSVAPGDDFNAYANGGWMKATSIPADKSSYGAGAMLVDRTRQQTIALIQDPVNAGPGATPDARKVADFYASFMDEEGIESKGVTPLKPELDAIAGIADKRALARVIGGTLRADVDPLNATNFQTENLFGVWIAQGLNDPEHNTPYLLQGGLGLPDRDYYVSTSPKMAELRGTVHAPRRGDPCARGVPAVAGPCRAHRRSRNEDRRRARDPRAVGGRGHRAGLETGSACRKGPWPRLVRAARGRRIEQRADLHRLAPGGGDGIVGAGGKGAARRLEGLARFPRRQPGHRRSPESVRRRGIFVLWKDAQRHAAAAGAMAARRRCDERCAR